MSSGAFTSRADPVETTTTTVAFSAETSDDEGAVEMERGNVEERMGLVDPKKVVVRSNGVVSGRCLIVSLGIVVLVVVISAIAVAISLPLTLSANQSASQGQVVDLDDVFNSSFQSKFFQASWTPDNALLSVSSNEGVVLFDTEGMTTTLLNSTMMNSYNVSSVKIAPNGNFLLLVSNWQKVYRHSFLANYFIYTLSDSTVVPVADGQVLQYAEWSPTSSNIAYVMENDVYLYDVQNKDSTRVTDDGKTNLYYNGIPDWVYEEEVLATNYALWWSPDGQQLLYLSLNDTLVTEFMFPIYGLSTNRYTEIDAIAYPKAGTTNPTVAAWVVDIMDTDSKTQLQPPTGFTEEYVLFGGWANSSTASVVWANREQNISVYCLYSSPDQSNCDKVYEQTSLAWNEILQPPLFVDGGAVMLILAPCEVNDDHFIHINSISTQNDGEHNCITNGEWEVTEIVATDETGEDILYISTQSDPWQRHVYSSKTKSCLTCPQDTWQIPQTDSPSFADRCEYFSASCSHNLTHCLLQCSGPSLPFSILVAYEEDKFEFVKLMEENEELQGVVTAVELPIVDMIEVPESNDGPKLFGRIMYPPFFSQSKKYPVLVFVYGGPYSQMIGNTSVVSRMSSVFLSSALDMIVVSIDGRGTGFRGDRFKHAVYRRLGLDETTDQLRAARYLQQMEYVDETKIAIYGSSYGGYMAGMVGSSGTGVFCAAISQSPVTDWMYYDSIYTERYMGQPSVKDNLNGYMQTSLLPRAVNLSMIHYLLIHGTGDDNVHFQNSAQLVKVLTEDEIEFRLQFYTDKAHSLSDDCARFVYVRTGMFVVDSTTLVTTDQSRQEWLTQVITN